MIPTIMLMKREPTQHDHTHEDFTFWVFKGKEHKDNRYFYCVREKDYFSWRELLEIPGNITTIYPIPKESQ